VISPRAKAVGEQGEHYDPLFTYKEGDEAGYFASQKDLEVMRLTLVLQALGLRREVLKLLAPLAGPRRVRRVKVSRLSVLTPSKIFQLSP